MKNYIKFAGAGIVLFLSMYFLFQNRWIYEQGFPIIFVKTKNSIIGFEHVKLAVQFIFLFFLGSVSTALCYIVKTSKYKKLIKENKKTISQMAEELKSLRNMPLTDTQTE